MKPYPPADATITPAPCWSPTDWTLRWNEDGTCFMVSTAGEVLGRCVGPGVIMRKDKKTGRERPLTICDIWNLTVQWVMERAQHNGERDKRDGRSLEP